MYSKQELLDLTSDELDKIAKNLEIEDIDYLDQEDTIDEILKAQGNKKIVEIEKPHAKKEVEITTIEKEFSNSELEEIFEFSKDDFIEDELADCSTDNSIYKDMNIVEYDNLIINIDKEILSYPAILYNEDGYIGQVKLKKIDGNGYKILGNHKNINFNRLKEYGEMSVAVFDAVEKEAFSNEIDYNVPKKGYTVVMEVEAEEAKTESNRLSIDFGTSNTTAGMANEKGEPVVVKFFNELEERFEETIPTIVYVENIDKSTESIKYLFGYAAQKKILENKYDYKSSAFFEIKRWINDIDKEEKIYDSKKRTINASRRSIIEAYLRHIILLSEEFFKCRFEYLSITAPVKLKERYLNEFYKMLSPEYKVMKGEKALDEGMAIIYNVIKKRIAEMEKNNAAFPPTGEKVLIIDSGGGTTDLASCNYKIKKSDKGYELDIKTNYVDGDTNFGGNNITYRILQLLKIKLAKIFSEEDLENRVDELISPIEEEILKEVDNALDSKKPLKLYKRFEREYKKAEKILPTIFINNEYYSKSKEQSLIKRNYYTLWNLAEIIKKEFFKKSGVLIIGSEEDERSKKITLSEIGKLELAIGDGKELNIDFNHEILKKFATDLQEIRLLIFGDIYKLLKTTLKDGVAVKDVNILKLSGQTCKIDIFTQLIKEFVSGKTLRKVLQKDKKEDPLELKLECIRGNIRYVDDMTRGRIVPKIENIENNFFYKLEIDERVHLYKKNDKLESIPKIYDINKAEKLTIKIIDDNNLEENTVNYNFSFNNINKSTRLEDLFADSNFIIDIDEVNDRLRNVENERRIIVLLPNKDGFSFALYEILRDKNGSFGLVNTVIYNCEKDISKVSFFNGEK